MTVASANALMTTMLPGPLMIDIMAVLWQHRRVPLSRLLFYVNDRRREQHRDRIKLSTLSTTLTRMMQRGYITKSSQSARSYAGLYDAAIEPDTMRERLYEAVDALFDEV